VSAQLRGTSERFWACDRQESDSYFVMGGTTESVPTIPAFSVRSPVSTLYGPAAVIGLLPVDHFGSLFDQRKGQIYQSEWQIFDEKKNRGRTH